MANRKEHFKKTLGITEYPWSSDDDDDDDDIIIPPDRANTEATLTRSLQQNVDEMPETSSGMASTQTDPALNQLRNPPVTRRERDTFWTLLRDRHTRIPRYRRYEEPSSSQMTVPENRPLSAAVGRILAFRKFARNLYSLPASGSSIANVNVPLSSAGPSRSPLFMPTAADMSGSIHSRTPAVLLQLNSHSNRARNDSLRASTSGQRGSRTTRRSSRTLALSRANIASNPITSNPISPIINNNNNSNHDIFEIGPGSGTTSTPNTRSPTTNHPRLSPQPIPTNNENEPHEVPAAEASTSAMSLEEEVLEIDLIDDNDTSGNASTEIDTAVDEATPQNVTEPLPSTSANACDKSKGQGVKRKRESSSSSGEPQTVKEFNQILLRLLECPVCLDWMEPPMAQCRRGHLVCGACRDRLTVCPVCRTIFSSVRNRAMEGVADVLRYPCRHGCGREVRLRKRGSHEASCEARLYQCPMPACVALMPLAYSMLASHFQSNHATMLKVGHKHKLSFKVNLNLNSKWIVMALDEFFHLRIDVDIRTWGINVYVAYIGPKKKANNFIYQIYVEGEYNARKFVYTRTTHSDLESILLSVSRQDCFHLTMDQALNFLRCKNKNCQSDKYLDLNLVLKKSDKSNVAKRDESDS